jgi:hypothetical protein
MRKVLYVCSFSTIFVSGFQPEVQAARRQVMQFSHEASARDSEIVYTHVGGMYVRTYMYTCRSRFDLVGVHVPFEAWAHSPQAGVQATTSLLRSARFLRQVRCCAPDQKWKFCVVFGQESRRQEEMEAAQGRPLALSDVVEIQFPSNSEPHIDNNSAQGNHLPASAMIALSPSYFPHKAFFILDRQKSPRHTLGPTIPSPRTLLLSHGGLFPSPRNLPERYLNASARFVTAAARNDGILQHHHPDRHVPRSSSHPNHPSNRWRGGLF